MTWVESQSLSFTARHDDTQAEDASKVLDALESFRERLEGVFERTPYEIAVVLHPRPLMLALAQPWLPLARMVAAPASRRYFAGWFGAHEIHVLAPSALEQRASGVEGSLEALLLTPQHGYAHLVLGANNPDLPPPFTVGSFRRYVRWAWLAEGAATHFSGQTPHLRAAIVRRLREGGRPDMPPSTRDARLLGGTVFALLQEDKGLDAAVELALTPDSSTPRHALEGLFGRSLASVSRDWRDYLDSLRAT
ncbi:MAG TPA: hypothetical protein VGF21_16515 [Thermoleophilaceae bacterium]